MPSLPFVFPVEPSQLAIQLKLNLPRQDSAWVVWWYSGIKKNKDAGSQPLALLTFREWIDGRPGSDAVHRSVPVTALGQMRLGSIWRRDESVADRWISQSRLRFEKMRFNLSFIEGAWHRTSFAIANPFPQQDIYPLQYPKDQNELLVFNLPEGGELVIPCTEFFTRCYGHSAELRRILLTYPWEEVLTRCYAPLGEPSEEAGKDKKWKVRLKMRLRNTDTVFLAHMKYDHYTQKRARELNSQLQSEFVIPEKLMFLKAMPWFQGPAELLCHGIPFDNGKSFLALRTLGVSDPDGILIERDRENSSLRMDDESNEQAGEAWSGTTQKRLVRPPDIVDLTASEEPDRGSDTVEILDEPFVTLGIPRAVVDRKGRKITERSGKRVSGAESSSYSSGDPYGTGKNVGQAEIHAPILMESHGAIRDLWNALLHLQRKYPKAIQSVEWFTFADGYRTGSDAPMIALEAFDEDDNVETDVRNWVFKNIKAKQLRGVLVARMRINQVLIHLIEIDRRPRTKKISKTREVDSEESYRGLIAHFGNEASFPAWLRGFLSDIRHVTGRVHKVLHTVPGSAYAFKHPADKPGQVPGEAAVLNALHKLKIALER